MRRLPQAICVSIALAASAGCFGSGEGKGSAPERVAAAAAPGANTKVPDDSAAAAKARKKAAREQSGSATLSWYPPTQNADGSTMSNLAGYRIYYGKSAKRLDQTIVIDNPGLTRYVVENLVPAKWYFTMTAVNASGKESERARPVSKKIT